jgi:hypothetical protein
VTRPENCRFAAPQSASPDAASPCAINSETRFSYHERRSPSDKGGARVVNNLIGPVAPAWSARSDWRGWESNSLEEGFPESLNKRSCTDQKAMPDRFPRPRINGIDVAKLEPRELGRIDDFDGQMWGSAAFCRYAINQLSVNLP